MLFIINSTILIYYKNTKYKIFTYKYIMDIGLLTDYIDTCDR